MKIGFKAIIGDYHYELCTLDTLDCLKGIIRDCKGVTFANPEGCVWVLAKHGDKVVGCAAVTISSKGVARFKSDGVLTSYRKQGIYRVLSTLRKKYTVAQGATRVTCFAGDMSRPQFLKDGFKVLNESRPGTTYMELVLTK